MYNPNFFPSHSVRETYYMREMHFICLSEARSYLSGQPISKSLELRQEFYQEVIRLYKRNTPYQIPAMTIREDCRFHCPCHVKEMLIFS